MAVRAGADDVEGLRKRGADGSGALQNGAQRIDLGGGPVGEIGNGAVVDLAVFAEALAQEDSGRGVAVGHDGDVHVDIIRQLYLQYKGNLSYYMTTLLTQNLRKPLSTKDPTCDRSWNFGLVDNRPCKINGLRWFAASRLCT